MPDADDCRHCGCPIVFEPYFLSETKLPNPPVWVHQGGGRACAVRSVPAGKLWPIAEPKETPCA